jgi:UDP-3-O-[3-hydroxymyristoyl] glucosamine N-acyltransferase
MVTYINQNKEATTSSPQQNKTHKRLKETSSNVVFLETTDSKKAKARAKLLRAAQKIRW